MDADNRTALHLACEVGHANLVAILLQHDDAAANVNAVSAKYRTALHEACGQCHAKVAEFCCNMVLM